MNARPHCTCVEVRNIKFAEALERLGCQERLLKDNLRRIPHQRFGVERVFCMCELRIAMRLFTVIPAEPATEVAVENDTPAVTTLRQIRPAKGRRKRASG